DNMPIVARPRQKTGQRVLPPNDRSYFHNAHCCAFTRSGPLA
ncbi:MAG: hypothetical protein ACI9M6_001273, partial [Hydrogenophaga sp.]